MTPADFERFFKACNRRFAFEALERAYLTYAGNPSDRSMSFAALRALVKACRLHGLGGDHAGMFAELGRVDDEAPATWQLVLQRRKPTRPHREKRKLDKARKTESARQSRHWRRFAAVMDKIAAGDVGLQTACEEVALEEGKNFDWPAVRADYLVIATQYRRAGLEAAEFGNDDAIRKIALPRRGRPTK
ncbi:MAG: hypothetical protein Q8R44_09205 [Novosphingobium sp.]|nr:hypothetical protein [Novosphingobium sp.]